MALVGLLASFAPILTDLAATPLPFRLTLAAMHVVAWACITRLLARVG